MSLKLIVKSLAWRRVTRRYPYEPHPVPEDFRGKVEFDPDACMGCGACANVCPPNAIEVIERPGEGVRVIKLFIGRCIFCGRCEENCPVAAVRQTDEFELASRSREDLEVLLKHVLAVDGEGHVMEYTERELAEAMELLATFEDRELVRKLGEYARMCRSCRVREGVNSIVKSLRPGLGGGEG